MSTRSLLIFRLSDRFYLSNPNICHLRDLAVTQFCVYQLTYNPDPCFFHSPKPAFHKATLVAVSLKKNNLIYTEIPF